MGKFTRYVEIGEPSSIADAITRGVIKAAERNDKILAILEDIGFPGISWFVENAPERIVECGVAESNAAVVAAGLAAEGFIPFIYGFGFAGIGRAYNQIRQSILVDRLNVKILAREGAWGEWGISHNYVEGIAATRVMPNLVIVNPADAIEAEKSVMAIAEYIGPVFLRLEIEAGSPSPIKIFREDYPFDIGKAYAIKDGESATIIATGYMVTEAIKASDHLEREGIDVRIINMSTIKPLDEDTVLKAAEETRAIVTAENHSIIGGLGEAVSAILAENVPTPMVRVGIEDEFSQSGMITEEVDELKAHFKLGAEGIVSAVKLSIDKKRYLYTRY